MLNSSMDYDAETVCEDLVRKHLPHLLEELADLQISESMLISSSNISGDMNCVCRVICELAEKRIFSVVVKMSMAVVPVSYLTYLKKDEVIHLDEEKMLHENTVLHAIADICPGSVPKVFILDKQRNAIIMEDLQNYTQFSEIVASTEFNKHTAVLERVAHFLGLLHRKTCLATMVERKKENFLDIYNNSKMRFLMSNLLFDRPLDPEDKTNTCRFELVPHAKEMRDNVELVKKVRKVQNAFLTQNDCLCHGDFSTDNIMVTSDDFKVVDMEFSGVGLRAYDLALLIQMLLLKLLGEYWKLCSQQYSTPYQEERSTRETYFHLNKDISPCGQAGTSLCSGNTSERELAETNIGQSLRCVLEGYQSGIGDCLELDVQEPQFVEQVCSLVACEMMWTVFGSYEVTEFCGAVEPEHKLLQLAEALLLHTDSTRDLLWNISKPLQDIFGIKLVGVKIE